MHPFDAIPQGAQVTVHPLPSLPGDPAPFAATWGGYDLVEDEDTGIPMPDELYVTLTDPASGPRLYPAEHMAGAALTFPWYDLRAIEYGGDLIGSVPGEE